jgi:hypothetical protein
VLAHVRRRWLQSYLRRHVEHARGRSFDLRFGVETTSRVTIAAIPIVGTNRGFAEGYMPTPIGMTRRILRRLEARCRDCVFVDFGSGKGRVLLLASDLPFRRVIGIEFAPQLHLVAERNIERYPSRCRRAEAVCDDAAAYEIPKEPCILFFANPFAAGVLRKIAARMSRSIQDDPRHITVVYVWPKERSVFDSLEFLKVREIGPEWIIYETAGGHIAKPVTAPRAGRRRGTSAAAG